MCSAFTKRPIHHIINSKESGAGKNYLLELVSRYFPDKYVIPLGNMSDKALFHRKGILVNAETVSAAVNVYTMATIDIATISNFFCIKYIYIRKKYISFLYYY